MNLILLIKKHILRGKNFSAKWPRGRAYLKKFLPEIIILLLAIFTAVFNLAFFQATEDFRDNSHLAKFLSHHPQQNPKLYARNSAVKIVIDNSAPGLPRAYAQSLSPVSENLEETSPLNPTHGEDILLNGLIIADYDSEERKPFEYEVQSGDTLSHIAEKFGLKLETVLWANGLSVKTVINPGQKLLLLPTDGVLHEVKKGDTLSEIAVLYDAETKEIAEYNKVEDAAKIHSGDLIIVPGGRPQQKLSAPPSSGDRKQESRRDFFAQSPQGKLLWPTDTKNLTQKYSPAHRGLDISNSQKLPIYASHGGTVEFAGQDGAWGYTIVIRGDDGLTTRYSHNAENYVKAGETVEAGDTIGKIGNTGNVRGKTGIHLDFRVYKNGVALNPLNFF